MKTSEFKKLVEELGYKMIDNVDDMVVYRNDKIVAIVYNNKVNSLDTYYGEDFPNELFDVMVEYTKTPVEERKSEKEYCLKLPIKGEPAVSYLNYEENLGNFSFMSKDEAYHWKTQFTQKEIDNLPNQDFIKTLIKEEV